MGRLSGGLGVRQIASENAIVQVTLDDIFVREAGKVIMEDSSEKLRHLGPTKEHQGKSCPRSFPQRKQLYEQGLSDSAIARAEGVFPSNIREWRMRRNLPPNLPRSFLQRQELYDQGLTDRKIAEKLGLCRDAIWRWRTRNKLPSNFNYRIKSDLINKFLKDCKARNFSPNTLRTYRNILGAFERFLKSGGKKIEEATLRDVRDFMNNLKEKGRSTGTIAHYLSIIKSFYDYVNLYHGISVPDLRRLRAEEYKPEAWEGAGREPLSRDEVRRLIEAPDNLRDRLLLAMLYYSLLRAGEAAGLEIEKVDTKKREICVVGKGNKPRKVPYHPKLDRLVDRWLNKVRRSYVNSGSSGYFFVSRSGGKLTVKQIEKITHEAAVKAGIQEVVAVKSDDTKIYKVKPHVLRHSGATHTHEDGVPMEHIRLIMGHKNVSTTMGYVKESKERIFKSYYENFKGI